MVEIEHIIKKSKVGRGSFKSGLLFNVGSHICDHLIPPFSSLALGDYPDLGKRNVKMVIFVAGTETVHRRCRVVTEFSQLLFLEIGKGVYPYG